jgi:hypothetical protein
MIQANELRIGNYVDYPLEGYDSIHKVTVETLRDIENGNQDITPIPLTEEILRNVKRFSHTHISKYRRNICFMNNQEGVCTFKQKLLQTYLYCDFKRNVFYIKHNNQKIFIQYLHDLQNKIFYLLGYELQIEL